ncbi:VOC family protein [Bacillus rhizoplanae]|uniref:VOC family protein n=1 Tax=Bacillus rhizoplanae TaxID=2880966 RepID=UPI003D208B2A
MSEKMYEPGIHHIEFWVANLEESMKFYRELFSIIGWKQLNETAFSTGKTEIYFKEIGVELVRTLGPRHICYQAIHRSVVDEVACFLHNVHATIIRGPIEVKEYSEGYYTVDFYDPNGYILEVVHAPNMEM